MDVKWGSKEWMTCNPQGWTGLLVSVSLPLSLDGGVSFGEAGALYHEV